MRDESDECKGAVHRSTNKKHDAKFPIHASFSFLTNEFTLERVSMNLMYTMI